MSAPPDAAAAAAAAKAALSATIEIWTLFAVAVACTVLRTAARVRAVGFRDLRADDYLVWLGIIFYAAQSALGWNVGAVAHGFANNDMTPEQRASLSVDDPEYTMRVIGSKIQVAGWSCYSTLIWMFKLSMLAFFLRLTEGLGRTYKIRIYIGFGIVAVTGIATIVTILGGCRPIDKYWQINPDPGNVCQAAQSRPIIWVSFISNVISDIYIMAIPLPMLWTSTLRTYKKIASSFVLGAGVFIIICAILKTVFVLIDPVHGAELAGMWGVREAFTAAIVTNLPMLFPLFKSWVSRLLGTNLDSSKNAYKSPTGIVTIGGGGGDSSSRPRRGNGYGGSSGNVITANVTFSESEERMMAEDIELQRLKAGGAQHGIVVHKDVEVTSEPRSSHHSKEEHHGRPGQAW